MWCQIDGHSLLTAFLPLLLFGDAMTLNFYMFKRCFVQCLILACPGVMVGTALTAVAARYVLWPVSVRARHVGHTVGPDQRRRLNCVHRPPPLRCASTAAAGGRRAPRQTDGWADGQRNTQRRAQTHGRPYNWDWSVCLCIGAILAATDPVAVVALLKSVGASPKLTMQITGESLMNDCTAIVLFMLFLTWVRAWGGGGGGNGMFAVVDGSTTYGVGYCLWKFLWMALGGYAIGWAIGALLQVRPITAGRSLSAEF